MPQEPILLDTLTERELEIIALLAEESSNKEIANQLFLAPNTVKWYITQVNSKLDTTNRQDIVKRANELGLLEVQAAADSYLRPRQNLPRQTTPFIGRDAELDEIHQIIEKDDVRLLTILAQGGMGKTRIALEASEQQLNRFPDGVYFVPLQALSDVNNIVPQIATSSGFQFSNEGRSQKEQLLDFLANKTMLLCIDNWEHLLEGVDLINEILQAAPDVKVLATSREKLNLMSETVYVLQGMHYPDWETPEDALEYDAVQLLMQSAQRVKPDWDITEDNLDYVARVCRLTQGMPLGILLATSWLDVYSLDRICDEIQKSVDILETEMRDVPERQRSIRAVFDYSWERLTPKEQAVLMKMSVFRGGCTPSAAEAVTEANARILQSLVNKALLLRNREGRYDVHELLRQYAEEHLKQSGNLNETYTAHTSYYIDTVAKNDDDILGAKQIEALNIVESEFQNIKIAWYWSVEQENHDSINRMINTVWYFCWFKGLRNDYLDMVNNALKKLGKSSELLWGRLIVQCVRFSDISRDEKISLTEQAITIARDNDDRKELAFALSTLAVLLPPKGHIDEAWHILEEALNLCYEVGDRVLERVILNEQAMIHAAFWQQWDEAQTLWQKALTNAKERGSYIGMAQTLSNLGVVELNQGLKLDKAASLLLESIDYSRLLKHKKEISFTLSVLASVMIYQGKFDLAEDYLSESLMLAKDINYPHLIIRALDCFASLRESQGDYTAQHALISEAITLGQSLPHPLPMIISTSYLGSALCGFNRYEAAWETFVEILDYLPNTEILSKCVFLFRFSIVIAHYKKHPERALAIMSLAQKYHPSTISWEHNALARDYQSYLLSILTQEEYDSAWERGKSLDLATVVQELVDEFGAKETQLPE